MKVSSRILLLAGAVFLAQWLVPVSMILGREQVLKHGTEVKFSVAPIDPYDPFRGRYVLINAAPVMTDPIEWPEGLKRGQTAFAILELDPRGFARSAKTVSEHPEQGLYLKGKVQWPSSRTLDFELTRYYMNEKMAPAAEEKVRNRWRETDEVYITARVLDGEAVITGLFVNDIPIEQLIATGE